MPKLNITNIVTTVAVCYLCYTALSLYSMFFPQECTKTSGCLIPNWSPSDKCALYISFTSEKPAGERQITNSSFVIEEGLNIRMNVSPPAAVFRNGSASARIRLKCDEQRPFFVDVAKLTSFREPTQTFIKLMSDESAARRSDANSTTSPVTFWLSTLRIYVLKAPLRFSTSAVPEELQPLFQTVPGDSNLFYYPLIYMNTERQPYRDWVEVQRKSLDDQTETYPPLDWTISVEALSVGRFRMHAMLEVLSQQMNSMGLKAKDIDEVRGLLLDNSFYILLTTVIVSVLHLLFDFLAFKNDVSFWRRAENTAGLSVRTVIWQFFSSLVIFLHLREQRSSLLVIVPMGISTCIEFWKLSRLFKVSFSLRRGISWGTRSQAEKATDQLDAHFMYWLVLLLLPLCVAGSVYSLFYLPHRSWYSWCLQTVVHGVYAFGFLLMTPQLFLNYRLKSVAHLPWKALTYKAFNTFIDDFFAFIIVMPTAHRIACLRDDVIFLIYLYQRWLYPVDKSRVNEFGQVCVDDAQEAVCDGAQDVASNALESKKQK